MQRVLELLLRVFRFATAGGFLHLLVAHRLLRLLAPRVRDERAVADQDQFELARLKPRDLDHFVCHDISPSVCGSHHYEPTTLNPDWRERRSW
jgi:hypothetical protein